MGKTGFGILALVGAILGFAGAPAAASTVTVTYALTLTGTAGDDANGTGTLVMDETSPINSYSVNYYGDFVSLVINVDGKTFTYLPSSSPTTSAAIDLGTNQTFYSLTGNTTATSDSIVYTLNLGGFGFYETYNGGPNPDQGTITIGPAQIDPAPLPPPWLCMLGGLIGLGYFTRYRRRASQTLTAHASQFG